MVGTLTGALKVRERKTALILVFIVNKIFHCTNLPQGPLVLDLSRLVTSQKIQFFLL